MHSMKNRLRATAHRKALWSATTASRRRSRTKIAPRQMERPRLARKKRCNTPRAALSPRQFRVQAMKALRSSDAMPRRKSRLTLIDFVAYVFQAANTLRLPPTRYFARKPARRSLFRRPSRAADRQAKKTFSEAPRRKFATNLCSLRCNAAPSRHRKKAWFSAAENVRLIKARPLLSMFEYAIHASKVLRAPCKTCLRKRNSARLDL
mmetsp:Transcript_25498/g.85660  ORF Transcript_25498/g.85660 Transcript_25498/m.85660 type:complete len:207 (-) Transcript_25498:891-1511(-)